VQINFDESIPIYVQIMQGVMWDVAVGTLAPGDKLLSVRDLARDAKTNPNTVQRAYMELERMGIVETQRGQGTFIKAGPELAKEVRSEVTTTAVRSFISEMRRLRYSNEEIVGLVSQGLGEASTADRDGQTTVTGQTVADGLAPGQPTKDPDGGVH
jgi:DNA-binding transcriptional regulator YhcF (GntR family)